MHNSITLLFPRSEFLLNESVFPPLGILYLSTELKKQGFGVQCLDMALGHTLDDILYDTVGISFTSPQRFQVYELVKELKRRGKYLIAGGAHATHMPMECIANGFDVVIQGEADLHLPNVLREREDSLTKAIVYAPCEPHNLSVIDFPDRDALDISLYNYTIDGICATVLMTSRGCSNSCAFCSRITNKFRMQSAQRTVDEIFHVREKYGFEAFMIFDDVFAVNRRRLYEMVDLLTDANIKFRCFARADILQDKLVCEGLFRMGVVEVGIGVESGSDTVLAKNFKRTTAETNAIAIKNLHEFGIRAKAFIIVGLPGESERTIHETEDWLKKTPVDDVDFSVFQPMPGSPIFKDPDKYGIRFDYENEPLWYKGTPKEYTTTVNINWGLASHEILGYRDYLENTFKNKSLLR